MVGGQWLSKWQLGWKGRCGSLLPPQAQSAKVRTPTVEAQNVARRKGGAEPGSGGQDGSEVHAIPESPHTGSPLLLWGPGRGKFCSLA